MSSLIYSNSITKIKSMIKPMVKDYNSNDIVTSTTKSDTFWDHHHQLAHSHEPDGDIDVEMIAYLRMPWEGMKNTYPNLHKMALQFLPVVGSSVPSERVSSAASYLLSQRRNRLDPNRLSRILFLQSIDKKYFFEKK